MIRGALLALLFSLLVPAATGADEINPAIDMEAHLRVAVEAASERESRRISEEQFIQMSREPDTVILDARSSEAYTDLHIAGAVNLSLPDITLARLEQIIPSPSSRILIYCNNNFERAEGPFPRKAASASLNLSTWVVLYAYGYRNVYELAPLIDITATILELAEGHLLSPLPRGEDAERSAAGEGSFE